jgi:ligand-binding SRPBCC domain-containing protein
MMVRVSTELDAPAEVVWAALKRKSCFLHVTRGLMGFPDAEEWPKEWRQGDEARTRLHFFHLIPGWEHSLRVIRVDEDKRELVSNETGGPVERWNHMLKVKPISGTLSLYTDEIEIRAGSLTPLLWVFAHVFYRYRQMRWRELARVLADTK